MRLLAKTSEMGGLFMRLFTTLHNYKKNYLAKDLIAGVVMAAVSIPIAMGYAEV